MLELGIRIELETGLGLELRFRLVLEQIRIESGYILTILTDSYRPEIKSDIQITFAHGFQANDISIKSGVRQYNPLGHYLFLLSVESEVFISRSAGANFGTSLII